MTSNEIHGEDSSTTTITANYSIFDLSTLIGIINSPDNLQFYVFSHNYWYDIVSSNCFAFKTCVHLKG